MVSERPEFGGIYGNCNWWRPKAPGAGTILVLPASQIVSQEFA